MATIQVWHAHMRDADARHKAFLGMAPADVTKALNGDDPEMEYKMVALVNTPIGRDREDDLDDAYRLTNNIDQPWILNDGVYPVDKAGRYRSTSVGDVLFHVTNNVWYTVARFGFERVEPPKGQQS